MFNVFHWIFFYYSHYTADVEKTKSWCRLNKACGGSAEVQYRKCVKYMFQASNVIRFELATVYNFRGSRSETIQRKI